MSTDPTLQAMTAELAAVTRRLEAIRAGRRAKRRVQSSPTAPRRVVVRTVPAMSIKGRMAIRRLRERRELAEAAACEERRAEAAAELEDRQRAERDWLWDHWISGKGPDRIDAAGYHAARRSLLRTHRRELEAIGDDPDA